MAKRKPIHAKRTLGLKVNDLILDRLEKLAGRGMRGNLHEDIGLIALRIGIEELERRRGHSDESSGVS